MSSIQELIAQSRLPGQFAEKRTFTFARKRAVEKMRQFALANPYYFILELVQAAVANGAKYISVESREDSFLFAYTGARYVEAELSQLFDFLLVGRARPELERVHGLALGVNALLRFEPERIEIVSGDGTLEGSVRAVVGGETLELGRPTKPIGGTFLKASGLRRKLVDTEYPSWKSEQKWPEYFVMEERCLSAPVPILYNSEPMFGAFASRIPPLAGYRRRVAFDEGDLYGTLGAYLVGDGRPLVKLLTYGVWVESVPFPGQEDWLGGVVSFDALQKTIDHAAFVRNDRWEELWYRLGAYIDARKRELRRSGQTRLSQVVVQTAEGSRRLSLQDFLEILPGCRLVCVSHRPLDGRALAVDSAIGVQVADRRDLIGVRIHVRRVRPDLPVVWVSEEAARTVWGPRAEHFTMPKALVEPVEADLVREQQVAELGLETTRWEPRIIVDPSGTEAPTEETFPVGESRIRLTALAPVQAEEVDGTVVYVCALGRILDRSVISSNYPGTVLVAEYLDAVPEAFLPSRRRDGRREILLRGMVRAASEALSETVERLVSEALERFRSDDVESLRLVRRVLLGAVEPVLRLDPERGPGLQFVLTDPRLPDELLEVPLFRTLGGQSFGLRRLGELCSEMGGLVYGVVEGVPPDLEGLDSSRILDLSPEEEEFVVHLVGSGTYVRVDQRDVLADSGMGVVCRDVALGLRDYPAFPLLVEGEGVGKVEGMDTQARMGLVRRLVQGLLERVRLEDRNQSGAQWEDLENLRHIRRHLQWLLAASEEHPELREVSEVAALRRYRLFDGPSGQRCSWEEVLAATASDQGAAVALRRHAGADDGRWSPRKGRARAELVPRVLLLSPFEARLVARVGRLRWGVVEVPESAEDPEPFLAVAPLRAGGLSGLVGLTPSHLLPGVRLLPEGAAPDLQEKLSALAGKFMLTAALRLESNAEDVSLEEVAGAFSREASTLLRGFLDRVWNTEGQERERLERSLLGLLDRGIRLFVAPAGHVQVRLLSPLASHLMEIEFGRHPKAGVLSPRRLLEAFATFGPAAFQAGESGARFVALDELPPVLREWVGRALVAGRLSAASGKDLGRLAASWKAGPAAAVGSEGERFTRLARVLTDWLAGLRTDLETQPEGRPAEMAALLWRRSRVAIGAPSLFPSGSSDNLVVLLYESENGASGFLTPWVRMRLRPGPGPGEVYVGETLAKGFRTVLALNPAHWLVRRAASLQPEEVGALAAGLYGYLNEEFDPGEGGVGDLVSDAHELAFLRGLMDLLARLEDGKLRET